LPIQQLLSSSGHRNDAFDSSQAHQIDKDNRGCTQAQCDRFTLFYCTKRCGSNTRSFRGILWPEQRYIYRQRDRFKLL